MGMASSRVCFLTVALLLHAIFISMATSSSTRCYKAIYSFGDSLADTGNDAYDDTRTLPSSQTLALNLPYGETYFHHPTGRWSDGRLIVDFIAEKMGLPLLKPYLGIKNGNIRDWNPTEGVNFAVAGATAVDSSFYLEKGIYNTATNYSLGVQLDWFMDLLPSICNSSSGCKEVLGSSLFLVGEIGGNDFNHPLFLYKSVTEIRTYVPLVVNQISLAINKLINLGAKTLMVPGNFPLGCNFMYLTMYETADKSEYDDEAGCLKWLNKFSQYYNKQLYTELNRLQVLHPNINIIYADYYHALLRLYQSPRQFGFTESISSACCPLRITANNNSNALCCGNPGVIACNDPSKYISWDGMHLTEAAYKWIAKGLLNGPYTNPQISISCNSDI